MRRNPPNRSISKKLFPEDNVHREASKDNLDNVLQEFINNDRERALKVWNFDTAADEPVEGIYKWHKDGELWIGTKAQETTNIDTTEDEENSPTQAKNESSPVPVINDTVPPIRKRRHTVQHDSRVQSVRRRILSSSDNLSQSDQ